MRINLRFRNFIFVILAVLLVNIVSKAEKPQNVTVENAIGILSNIQVLDVRTPQEFSKGHIEGAINIDVNDEAFAKKVAELETGKTYLVHCAANLENGRATKAMSQMKALGFLNLKNLEGGYIAWVKSGRKVVK